jgi:uncharacterized protein (UPF0333 family)
MKLNFKSAKGQVMLLTALLIWGIVLSATSLASLLTIYQFRQVGDITNSAKAIFAADSGIECMLYKYNVNDPINPRQIDCGETNPVALSNGATFQTYPDQNISVGTSARSSRAFELDFNALTP